VAQRAYDVVIVGSGPAGYTAALYASRANMKVLVFQGFESGGQLMLTSDVENYPGYKDGVMGPEMMDDFEAQAARFGAEMRPDNVERVDFSERPFKLWPEDSEADEPVLTNTVVEDILGEDSVEGVRLRNTESGEEQTIELSGFFTAIGHAPATSLF